MAMFSYNYTLVFSFTSKNKTLRICGLLSFPFGISLEEITFSRKERFSSLEIYTNKSVSEVREHLGRNQVEGLEGILDHTHKLAYSAPEWGAPLTL